MASSVLGGSIQKESGVRSFLYYCMALASAVLLIALNFPYILSIQPAGLRVLCLLVLSAAPISAATILLNWLKDLRQARISEHRRRFARHVRIRREKDALLRLAVSKSICSGDLDAALREITETAAQILEVERASIWIFGQDYTKLTCLDLFLASPARHSSSGELFKQSSLPYFEALRNDRTLAVHDTASDPLTSCFPHMRELGVSSMLSSPFHVDGRLAGVVCHEHTGERRTWDFDEQNFAASIADMAAMAFQSGEMRKLQGQLIQAQKMEAVGQLAGGIAHDFNNVLTGILGYASLIRTTYPGERDIVSITELIESAAQRASQLTQKLLGFARKGKHQNVPVDIHAMVNDTLALLGQTIEKNVSIKRKLLAEKRFVSGDPIQLQQVVMNLAINARDAMSRESGGSDGGELTVMTRIMEVREGSNEASAGLLPGTYLELSVSDTGCGIAPEIQDKIYEPFFTTKDPARGTGMGLAMVYGIVRNHGGSVSLQSAVNLGTTFRVLFPSVERPLAEQIEIHTDAARQARIVMGSGQILLVDDHRIMRDVTARMLSALGYEVITASDGVEALEHYRRHGHEIDLVIIDMVMPRMGARECLREIRRINPEVKVILSTGYGNNHLVQEILNEGTNGFMQKPFELSRLSQVVSGALSHVTHAQAAITDRSG